MGKVPITLPVSAFTKTMALDPKTHQLFVPANESGSFGVLVFGK